MATKPTPIGLVLPIQNSNRGYFDQAFDTFTQKRMNLINLLRTRPGERRFSNFGSRLWTVTFEQNTGILKDVITKIVSEDTAQWIDGVIILNVSVQVPQQSDATTSDVDIYSVLVTVTFQDTATQQTGDIQVLLNTGNV